MGTTRSAALLERASQIIPGGVNSPVRAFRSVGGSPPFIVSGRGSRITDADGNEYVDYVGSWGPLILGHAHPGVLADAVEAIGRGTSFGAPTEGEVRLAEAIVAAVPSIEMVRLVNSGTEAVMSALRLARGATGRDRIVKFDGCYHGHADGLLASGGSGLATLGIPDCPGVPAAFAALTTSLPYNDLEAVERVFAAHGEEIAAVIVEPVAGNMGCVPPAPGFLHGLREVTARHGALLVLDEVMTGFRVAYGGAQQLYEVRPDLTTLGKVVGGGFPLAAYGGRADLMRRMAPSGPIYQAGTLSGNPVAVAAGLAQLRLLEDGAVYGHLDRLGALLEDGLRRIAAESGLPACVNRVGSMLTTFFTPGPVRNYEEARASDTARFAGFFQGMLRRGIYLAPSQFEAAFLSAAHTEEDIENTLSAARECCREIWEKE